MRFAVLKISERTKVRQMVRGKSEHVCPIRLQVTMIEILEPLLIDVDVGTAQVDSPGKLLVEGLSKHAAATADVRSDHVDPSFCVICSWLATHNPRNRNPSRRDTLQGSRRRRTRRHPLPQARANSEPPGLSHQQRLETRQDDGLSGVELPIQEAGIRSGVARGVRRTAGRSGPTG